MRNTVVYIWIFINLFPKSLASTTQRRLKFPSSFLRRRNLITEFSPLCRREDKRNFFIREVQVVGGETSSSLLEPREKTIKINLRMPTADCWGNRKIVIQRLPALWMAVFNSLQNNNDRIRPTLTWIHIISKHVSWEWVQPIRGYLHIHVPSL